MKGIGRIAAVLVRLGQFVQDVLEFDEAARPAVRQYQRDGVGVGRGPVQEVQLQTFHFGGVLRQQVQLPLLLSPVEFVPPVADDFAQPVQRHPAGPVVACGCELCWPADAVEAPMQVGHGFGGDVDGEGGGGGHDGRRKLERGFL